MIKERKKKEKSEASEVVSCCNLCGRKRYKTIREAKGITISMGFCPICKQEVPIIPALDWYWMMGKTEYWD